MPKEIPQNAGDQQTSQSRARAAIYARTNIDSRSHSGFISINNQVESCLAVATLNGYSENDIHIYKDEGISGASISFLHLTVCC